MLNLFLERCISTLAATHLTKLHFVCQIEELSTIAFLTTNSDSTDISNNYIDPVTE